MTKKKYEKTAIWAIGVVTASTVLAGCGSSAPAAGNNSDLQSQSANSQTQAQTQSSGQDVSNDMSFAPAGLDTGMYADGTYKTSGHYGDHGSNTLDVSVNVQDGKVVGLVAQPHADDALSKKFAQGFVQHINGAVMGKDLKDLKVETVAGASWTTQAFNRALDNIRGDASSARSDSQTHSNH